jgi:hypothetical protein
MEQSIPEGYEIISRIPGKIIQGDPVIEANWGYRVKDSSNNELILLHCKPNVFTIVDTDKLDTIRNVFGKNPTWYLMATGYVGTHATINDKKTMITMHQFLMNYFGNGKGQHSIDHINRNKLDNRMSNLRITSQSEQNKNRDKVSRKYNARELPDGLRQSDLPKYVVYYNEKIYPITETNKDKRREFFRVEKHPVQVLKSQDPKSYSEDIKVDWATSKAGSKTIREKLDEAKQYLEKLNLL